VRSVAALTALAALTIVAAGCGGQSSAEAGFRTKANQACRSAARDALGLPASSKRKLATGLELLQETSTRLARVHAPGRDSRAFRDLIARLHGAATASKANDPEIYALDHRFEREMKSFGSPGTNRIPHVNVHLLKRINALARPPLRDIRLAGQDARALKLSACTVGVHSSVSINPTMQKTTYTRIGVIKDKNP
jgi:hypothetical protein